MTRTHHTIVPLAAIAFALGACGNDREKTSTSKPAAAPQAGLPYGTYTRELTKADVQRTAQTRDAARQETGPNMELPPIGQYRLVISKSAVGDVVDNIGPDNLKIGMYAHADGGKLVLEDYVDPSKGAFCGPEVAVPANYRFEVGAGTLTIATDAHDPCADRDTSLVGTWHKE
jgi:hypothetical protein